MVTRILSGMRPTGRLHIGHLVGALDNWVELQDRHESFFFVADYHAITTQLDTGEIRQDSIEMARDWLAAGIDPDKSTLFIQSQVPQHPELHLIFSMLRNIPRLERLPTFKDQLKQVLGIKDPDGAVELTDEQIARARSDISYGFLGYPVLQAADILVYRADGVPVGEDQLPHLELTREIARGFNRQYGEVFPEPEAILTNTPRILGTDGRKMSKSYGNAVLPTDALDTIRAGVKRMVTDPDRKRRSDPGDPRVCSVYSLHLAYSPEDRQLAIDKACRGADIGCVECKGEAAGNIFATYGAYRERRAALEGQDDRIREMLLDGSAKARRVAAETMAEVKRHMLMDYGAD